MFIEQNHNSQRRSNSINSRLVPGSSSFLFSDLCETASTLILYDSDSTHVHIFYQREVAGFQFNCCLMFFLKDFKKPQHKVISKSIYDVQVSPVFVKSTFLLVRFYEKLTLILLFSPTSEMVERKEAITFNLYVKILFRNDLNAMHNFFFKR